MSGPLISVVIPAYESAEFIGAAVQSVIDQTYRPLEIILIVEPSSDATGEIASRLAGLAGDDARIIPVFNEKLLGPAGSRNLGVALAKGDYVAFLDADDLWLPEKLERQTEAMQRTGAALCCTSYVFMSRTGQPKALTYHVDGPINFRDMLRENMIGPSTCLLKSGVAKAYQMDEAYFHEDYVYFLSVLRDGHAAYGIDEPLMRYRVSPKSRSRNKILTAHHRWMVYRKFMRMNFFESLYYWTWYVLRALRKYSQRKIWNN